MEDSTSTSAMEVVARVPEEQRISYVVTPQQDMLMSAKSLGGQLIALSNLFSAHAKEDGIGKVHTLISGISLDKDTGAVRFDFLICPDRPSRQKQDT